jgi:hypothetical protein
MGWNITIRTKRIRVEFQQTLSNGLIYSLILSISGGRLLYLQSDDALCHCCKEPTDHGSRYFSRKDEAFCSLQ